MNSKKIIEKLFKIAVNQQKIIAQLAIDRIDPYTGEFIPQKLKEDKKSLDLNPYPKDHLTESYKIPTNDQDKNLITSWANEVANKVQLGIEHNILVTKMSDGRYLVYAGALNNNKEEFKNNFFKLMEQNHRNDLWEKVVFNFLT